jgi:hypothetical protein
MAAKAMDYRPQEDLLTRGVNSREKLETAGWGACRIPREVDSSRLPPEWGDERIRDRRPGMRSTTARSPVSSSLVFFAVILGLPAPAPAMHAQTGRQFFESKVRPILVNRCGNCHGEKKQQARPQSGA